MKIRITRGYTDGKNHYKVGDVLEVSNNVAFGLMERRMCVAHKDILKVDFKEVEAPAKDKMMSKNRKTVITKAI